MMRTVHEAIFGDIITTTLIFLTLVTVVTSHGYVSSPRSINWRAHVDGIEWGEEAGKAPKEYCYHCLNTKNPTGVCGKSGDHDYDDFRDTLGNPMPWLTEAVYTEGQIITVRSHLPAHHWGHGELRGCADGMDSTLECFNQYPLEYVDDVMHGGIIPRHEGYPMYAHFMEFEIKEYEHRFKLPMGLVGQQVLLQWKYITSNSCNPPGYLDYPWPNSNWWGGANLGNCNPPPYTEDGSRPAGVPEQFWNCIQVTIVPSGPTTSPVPTHAHVTQAPNSPRPTNQPQQPISQAPIPSGSQIATTTRYWDCSGGSCGCAYLPSHLAGDHNKPAHCYSNALFAAPEGNAYGAKFYGAAAVSTELGGSNWLGDGCGKCWKVTGTSNIPGYEGIETTLVLKGTNNCPPEAQHCELGKAHFDIAAPGFDWAGASLSNSCQEREPTEIAGFEACGNWMINSQDPTQYCNCEYFTDSTLRDGCENFQSLYWDNPQVIYEEVACPDEMVTPCWEENGNSYHEFGEIPDTCMNPSGERPPTLAPVPNSPPVESPVGSPSGGFCNWGPNGDAESSTCEGGAQGGEWCNESQNNCEVGCGGRWCLSQTTSPVASPTSSPVVNPTSSPVASPTSSPVASPTSSPVANPTSSSPIISPTRPLKCKPECLEDTRPWDKLCKKNKCKGCEQCLSTNPPVPAPTEPAPTEPAPTEPAPTVPAPTVPAPTSDDYCCTWNMYHCGVDQVCNESEDQCQVDCGGTWLLKSGLAQCISKYVECTANVNSCCSGLTCLGGSEYKQCV